MSSHWSFERSGGEHTNFAPVEAVPEVVQRQEQVLRARLGEGLGAAVAGRPDLGQGLPRGEVDDVDGDPGGFGQADHPVGRLAFEDGLAGQAVPDRVGRAGGDGLLGDDVDGHAVLGVHHDQPAVLGGLLHRPEDRAVVAVEDARVGREQLEVGDALGDQAVHLGQGRVVDVAHDHVEAVVGDGIAFGLGVPGVETLAQRGATRLDGEVHDRGRPAEGSGARPALERILGERAPERQLHVGMDVDAARDHVLAGRVDGLVGGHRHRQVPSDEGDRLAVDQHVGGGRAVGADDGPVGDQRAHRSLLRDGSILADCVNPPDGNHRSPRGRSSPPGRMRHRRSARPSRGRTPRARRGR